MPRLPDAARWAFCDAVRSCILHLLADRMTMAALAAVRARTRSRRNVRGRGVGNGSCGKAKAKQAPTLAGGRLGQLDHRSPLVLAVRHIETGNVATGRSIGDAPRSGPETRSGLRRGHVVTTDLIYY